MFYQLPPHPGPGSSRNDVSNLANEQCEDEYAHEPGGSHEQILFRVLRLGVLADRGCGFRREVEAADVGIAFVIIHPVIGSKTCKNRVVISFTNHFFNVKTMTIKCVCVVFISDSQEH